MRLYADGALLSEKTSPVDYNGTPTLSLGKTEIANSSFSGALAEVRV